MPGPGNRPEAPKVYSQVQGPGMRPVYSGFSRDGKPTGFLGYEQDPSQGIIDIPKPDAILAEQARLGGKNIEPIYAETTVSRGHGGSEIVRYGPPIGYRYDNGNSEYVNFTPSGEYQGTVKRQSGIDLGMLAILAAPFLGPLVFDALGLTGAGTGLLASEGAVSALPLSQLATAANLTPAAIESLLGTAGYGVNASALEAALAAGIPSAQVGAGALEAFQGVTAIPPQLTPAAIESGLGTAGYGANASAIESGLFNPELIGAGAATGEPLTLPSWVTPTNALLAASTLSGIANANKDEPTAPTFTMPAYVPPSGKPFANLGMSPIATPYTPTRIAGQYDPTMTPGGVSPYEMLMQQMQAPKNLYADFEAGTAMGGFNPQKFVTKPAASTPVASSTNNMGGMTVSGSLLNANLGAALPNEINSAALGAASGAGLPNYMNGIELMNAINSGKISKGNLSGLLQA